VTTGGDAVRRGTARLALFVALALLTRAPLLTVPFLDLDEAAALLGSWTLLEGGTLYVDFVDNRPPLLYGLYAVGQLLLGRGMLAVRLLTAVVVLPLTAFAASAFFRHDRRGLVAGLLYLVCGAAFLAHDMHAVSAEVLMLLPLGWAVALLPGEEVTAPSDLHRWGRYPLKGSPRLNAFVRSDYRAVADVDGVWIWRRRGCEVPPFIGVA